MEEADDDDDGDDNDDADDDDVVDDKLVNCFCFRRASRLTTVLLVIK